MKHALHRILLLQLLTTLGLQALGSEIINGEKVPDKKMLFMASVQNSRNKHICGGFLINKDFVVTAAHCDVGNPTSVVLGTHNLKNIDDTMRYSVKRCKHRCYDKVCEGSDIMLLKLSKKAQLNQRLQPISLPETETRIANRETCSVAGWGLTSVGDPDELQMVNVPIVDLDVCKNEWPNMLPEKVICAGGYGTNKGFCQGDSGGPLVCNGKAAGVVSYNWDNNCRYPNRPNVYTDVSKFLPWIRKMMKDC
ncbi:mast cell protease 1A-like isoform X2 [Notothenia coriiceps]|uniref:Mast cell protease 1A-like isoform X2 n=1 Tax=Notothenia coriiceps TaxID=8208 RepID=A0A6I9PUJ0_9TELE|nr:PREDICTED: mast cell protease 1A-like isoform X2 [Notothenia coriiceps]